MLDGEFLGGGVGAFVNSPVDGEAFIEWALALVLESELGILRGCEVPAEAAVAFGADFRGDEALLDLFGGVHDVEEVELAALAFVEIEADLVAPGFFLELLLLFFGVAASAVFVGEKIDGDGEVERVFQAALVCDTAGEADSSLVLADCDLEFCVAGDGAADGDGFLGIEDGGAVAGVDVGIDLLADGFSAGEGLDDVELDVHGVGDGDGSAIALERLEHAVALGAKEEAGIAILEGNEGSEPGLFLQHRKIGAGGEGCGDRESREGEGGEWLFHGNKEYHGTGGVGFKVEVIKGVWRDWYGFIASRIAELLARLIGGRKG